MRREVHTSDTLAVRAVRANVPPERVQKSQGPASAGGAFGQARPGQDFPARAPTVSRELTVLKHMASRAVAWGFLAAESLTGKNGVKAYPEPKARVRYLSPDETDRLLEARATAPTNA